MLTKQEEKAFGKNDIRSIVGEGISPRLFKYVGRAYGSYVIERLGEEAKSKSIWVSVGYDARHHSPELKAAVLEGLSAKGINVLDLGLCPTPLGYFSEVAIKEPYIEFSEKLKNPEPLVVGTLIITASHNPSEYNGLKMTFKGVSFDADEISKLKELTKAEMLRPGMNASRYGLIKKYDATADYIHKISESFAKVNGIKIVTDCGNATAGVIAPELYKTLGCETVEIFSEPDGDFPNHHPNPSEEENLEDLKKKVVEVGADFGLAFDGDSDRVGVVDDLGRAIPGDVLLLIFALDIIETLKPRGERPVIVSEVKCSQVMYDMINQSGGEAVMWKTGHGFIKSKMRERGALLAGEMSGHIFFKDRYYGFDDAIYAGCRFIEILAKKRLKNPNLKVSQIVDALPFKSASRELRYRCEDDLKQGTLKELKKMMDKDDMIFGNKIREVITIDGMRVIFEDGFALIRASNTEPVFTLRFEAEDEKTAKMYEAKITENIDKCMEITRNQISADVK